MTECGPFSSRHRHKIVWAHAKFDGNCTEFRRDDKGVVTALTTNGYDEWPRLKLNKWATLLVRKMPNDSVFLGEVFVPGKPASAVKHHIASGKRLDVRFFAIPRLHGRDWSKATMDDVDDMFKLLGLPFAGPLIKLPEGWTEDKLLQMSSDLPDVEGWVLKGGHMEDWYKLKNERTIDLVVTGFVDGEGKNLGLVGSLRCSATLPDGSRQEIARAGGMDEDVRLAVDEKKDLGRVVEIKYQYVGSKGRLRHPRFVCWRDDKRADERTGVDQDPALEEYWTCE
jgi:hypothetical protein